MKKAINTILKIGGIVIAIAGVACIVKWAVTEFLSGNKNDNKENDELKFDDEFEEVSKEYYVPVVDVNVARSEATEEILLRHQEAAKAMKEMLSEIDESRKDEPEGEDEAEGRLNFDDVDVSLDKLFEEE